MPAASQAWMTEEPLGTSTSMPSTVSLAIMRTFAMTWIFLLCRHAHRGHADAGPVRRDPRFHLRPEMPDQPLDRPGRGIAQRADRMTLDLPGHLLQRVDLREFGAAFGHARPPPPHPAGAFATWRALAAAFVHIEFRQPGNGLDDVGGLVHHDDRRGAQS